MPPVLDPKHSKVDGLAFLGLSLSRKGKYGHPRSSTHQQAFDLDLVQDRNYEYVFSSNDDGWLAGGGEPGPPHSYKLPAKDSAHVEIMRIGTYRPDWGGIPEELVVETLRNGEILIPEITVVPTAVVANGDKPPELEVRFDMVPSVPNFNDLSAPLPLNWQLRFIQNQLFHKFQFASRFTPGAFHATILRKAEFRSEKAREQYFKKCQLVCGKWMERGAQPLGPTRGGIASNIKTIQCVRRETQVIESGNSDESRFDCEDDDLQDYYRSGLWLFTDRNTISHQFLPNFLPPYDTPSKKKLILQVLKEEWDEKTLSWKKHTSRFDRLTEFLPPGLLDRGEGPRKMVAVSSGEETSKTRGDKYMKPQPVEVKTPSTANSNNPKNYNLGILDPNDDIGFTHFVRHLGAEMVNFTTEVCRPMTVSPLENGDNADSIVVGANSLLCDRSVRTGEFSTDADGGVSGDELLARIAANRRSPRERYSDGSPSPQVKAVVSGQRVSRNHRREGIDPSM